MNPLISLCVPIYGVENYIKRCAESLLVQEYNNIEYIFVNDCTRDRSIEILIDTIANFPNKKDKIKIINHEVNKGLAAARNTAVRNAKGDYIWHIDSDDYISKDAVNRIILFLKNKSFDLITIQAHAFYPNYEEDIKEPIFKNKIEMTIKIIDGTAHSYIWNRIIKRSLYIDNNIKCKEGLNMGEDRHVVPLLAYYSNSVGTIDEIIYFYEARNIAAYTKSFSVEKEIQKEKSEEILINFFSDKGFEYVSALNDFKIRNTFSKMIQSAKLSNYSQYKELYSIVKGFSKNSVKIIPRNKRILRYISNPYIAKFYVLFSSNCKHLIKRIKTKS